MKIQQVYQRYKIPTNLQQHMLRVGAVAKIILGNWNGKEIDHDAVLYTSLLHDIGKPVTFNLDNESQFIKDVKELDELKVMVGELIDKYGRDEHEVCMEIFNELGLSDSAKRLIGNLEWEYTDRLITDEDIESLVVTC